LPFPLSFWVYFQNIPRYFPQQNKTKRGRLSGCEILTIGFIIDSFCAFANIFLPGGGFALTDGASGDRFEIEIYRAVWLKTRERRGIHGSDKAGT
jgi:hypothetical protein